MDTEVRSLDEVTMMCSFPLTWMSKTSFLFLVIDPRVGDWVLVSKHGRHGRLTRAVKDVFTKGRDFKGSVTSLNGSTFHTGVLITFGGTKVDVQSKSLAKLRLLEENWITGAVIVTPVVVTPSLVDGQEEIRNHSWVRPQRTNQNNFCCISCGGRTYLEMWVTANRRGSKE